MNNEFQYQLVSHHVPILKKLSEAILHLKVNDLVEVSELMNDVIAVYSDKENGLVNNIRLQRDLLLARTYYQSVESKSLDICCWNDPDNKLQDTLREVSDDMVNGVWEGFTFGKIDIVGVMTLLSRVLEALKETSYTAAEIEIELVKSVETINLVTQMLTVEPFASLAISLPEMLEVHRRLHDETCKAYESCDLKGFLRTFVKLKEERVTLIREMIDTIKQNIRVGKMLYEFDANWRNYCKVTEFSDLNRIISDWPTFRDRVETYLAELVKVNGDWGKERITINEGV